MRCSLICMLTVPVAMIVACGDDGGGSFDTITTTNMTTSTTGGGTGSTTASTTMPEPSTSDGTDSGPTTGAPTTGDTSMCGNGMVEPPEECDDGNVDDGDGCESDCTETTDTSVWKKTHDGGKAGADGAYGVAIDSTGNAIVAGFTLEDPTIADIWVRKYDTDGNEVWTQAHAGMEPMGDDRGLSVAVAGNDDIVVVGTVQNAPGNSDVWIRRYDAAGMEVWTQIYDGPAAGDDQANGVDVGGGDEIVVVGTSRNAAGNNDIWIAEYDGGGMAGWTDIVDGPGATDDEGRAVAIDAMGNVVVAGWVAVPDASSDGWLRKYDGDGNELWTETFGGPSMGEDRFDDVAVDASGNIVVAGHTTQGAGGLNVFVRKYDPDKALLFTHYYNAPFSSNDAGQGVATDADGNFVVAGYKTVADGNQDIWVRKFDPGGLVLWSQAFAGMTGSRDEAHDIAIDTDGNSFVVGQIRSSGENADIWVAKLAP